MAEDEVKDEQLDAPRLSRRGALGVVAGAIVGAVAAGSVPAEAIGTTGQPLLLGQQNFALGPTSLGLLPSTDIAPAIEILNLIDLSGTIGSGASLATNVAGIVGFVGGEVTTATADFARAGSVGLGGELPGVLGLVGSAGPFAVTFTSTDLRAGSVGLSPDSPGVLGIVGSRFTANPSAITATAMAFPRAGVVGLSPDSQGVLGMVGATYNQPITFTSTSTGFLQGGVVGLSDHAVGLLGVAGASNVVSAVTATASWIGVRGVALDARAVGVEAVGAEHGLALNVVGTVSFSSSGRGTIPANTLNFVVIDKNVKATSSVFVSLLGNPGVAAVKWTELNAGVSFTIHLTKASTAKLPFAYFRIN